MIQYDTEYIIDGGPGTIIFRQDKDGTIHGTFINHKHKENGTIKASLTGNTLQGVFHNKTYNASGLVELTFDENGFVGKWKPGLEEGPKRGKWEGAIKSDPNALRCSIPNAIVELLEAQLIQPKEGLQPVYDNLKRFFLEQNTDQKLESEASVQVDLDVQDLKGDFSNLKEKAIRTVGIDFPIVLKKGKNRPLIMVCALDPLRTDAPGDNTKISDWVPFSVIKNLDKETRHSEKENLKFFHTLLETYDLYITDIYKVFFRMDGKLSNQIKEFTKLGIHKTLLEAEINCIQPQAIITLGNGPKDAICQLYNITAPAWSEQPSLLKLNDHTELLCLPHISGAANGTKAILLNNDAFSSLDGKGNTRYANIAKTILEGGWTISDPV